LVLLAFVFKLRNNRAMSHHRGIALFVLVASLVVGPWQSAQAEAGREFLLSCTYGVLAGALVGAASLAVEDNPSDKVHRVARGASLGLYTGILLGLYVVYVVPAQIEAEQEENLEEQYEDVIDPEDYGLRREPLRFKSQMRVIEPPKLTIYPVMENQRITGAAFNYSIVRF
jgi:hypothetical protein